MKRILWLALGVLAVAWQTGAAEMRTVHVFQHENVLGTSLELKFIATSDASASNAEAAVLTEIDRLSKILSSYDPGSEFSCWRQTSQSPVPVSHELFEVLATFDKWRERSGGALDASAEVVCQLWKDGSARQRLPSDDSIAAAVASVKRPHWLLESAAKTATHLDDAPLVLNSFTKSYIASRACDSAKRVAGVSAAVVNIGGDLVVRGDWTESVDIADPHSDAENSEPIARLRIHDRTVATSGGYRRGFEIAGKRYSHIVDPRTGRPADRILSATVVAPDATDAGALATALCVLTPAESLSLIASIPEVECLLVTRDGNRVVSPGWNRLESRPAQLAAVGDASAIAAAVPTAASVAWDSSFELTVTLELARIESQRAKRPYVAVWIEDKDKFPVRTIALWFAKPKWLPDLRSWTHSDKLRALTDGTDLSSSISSATRSPGKYTLKWDGKDDKGQLVKPGKYTVFVEAAREHGTHQIMRQEMEFNGTAQKAALAGNIEITAASLDYHRKTEAR